ncbi:hypothetical protein TWF718_002976 [Orbilia javanica]|uniref:F-box domain-containing protein n=1 Tax=Orbilia javanica TaxID=47235 RepID=A0AAN8MGW9_9PEZI
MTQITNLPTELLLQILTQVLSSRSFKARDVSRLASVCRRFYIIVLNYLYTNCDILLHRREGYSQMGHVVTLSRFGGETDHEMFANARKTFKAYESHGEEVKYLSLKTTRGLALGGPLPYQGPLKFTTCLPTFTSSLATTFPNLTTLSFTDTLQTPIPMATLISILTAILTTSPSLKHLSLALLSHRSRDLYTGSQEILQSLSSELKSPSALPSLESLSLDIHLVPVRPATLSRWARPFPDPTVPIWFLSSLSSLLQPQTLSSLKSLSFLVTGYIPFSSNTRPTAGQLEGISTDDSLKLVLPKLESLVLSMTEGCVDLFPLFVAGRSYRAVSHLEILDTFEVKLDVLLSLLKTSFPTLHSLTLKKIDTRRPLNWRFLSYLKSTILEHLKLITIYTSATISKISGDLGHVFMANAVQNIYREKILPEERTMHDGAVWRVIVEFAY